MKKDKKRIAGLAVAAVGVLLMLMGVADNQHSDVFEKAIRICLECIGIG